jgi:pimeloyl-ACP methyl ester carboxylesterase
MARHDHDRVVVVGASMGAIAVLGHAAHDTGLAGVVTVSAPSRWVLPLRPQAVLAAILTRTPPGRFLVSAALRVRVDPRRGDPAAPVELAGRVTAPYAVVHGTRDRFIPVACAHDLHAAAPASTLHLVEDLGHAYQPAGVETIVTAVRTMAQAPAAVAAPA